MLWLLHKPRVYIIPPLPKGIWYHYFEDGDKLAGARIILNISFWNDGNDATSIDINYKVNIRGKFVIFTTDELIELAGHGAKKRTKMVLKAVEGRKLKEGEILHGVLSCKPWGNRRMCFGKEYLDKELDVPYGSGKDYYINTQIEK